ncbi:MAG: trigger factor [Patescibacteria group bacterium]|nr:trigger factor [Patescibacteria group bacterium]
MVSMKINNLEINKLEKSIVEIKGEIETADFEKARETAISKLSEHIELDGFRKGKAPKDMVIAKLGDQIILEEMAQTTLSKAYPQIITENKIDAIGYPQINITKLANGNPLGFTILTAVIPEINLPDYKALSKEVLKTAEKAEVKNEEYESFIKQIRRAKAHDDFHKANPDIKGHDHPEIKDEDLPELDMEYLNTLGNFSDMQDFETKVKADILKDKEFKAKEKIRLAIIEAIEKETKIDVPDILVNSETEKMIARMKSDIEKMGLKYEDYLKSLGKSDEDIRNEFKGDAEKRAKVQMVVGEIAVKENLRPDAEKVKEEVKKVMDAYKDADENSAKMYIESVLVNEEVFKFLENQK